MKLPFHPKLFDTLPGYGRGQFLHDVSSGITVGVLALPLAMAFAIASGMSPSAGIWTAIVAGALISALGGSKVQIGGPTGAFIPIIYGIVVTYGVANLLIATMLAGIFLVGMALGRVGNLIRFIPKTVVIGFTNGIAVVIFLAQIKDFLGLHIPSLPAEFFEKIQALFEHIHTFDGPTLALSLASLAVLLGYNRLAQSFAPLRRAPGPLAVLVLGTAAAAVLDLPVETIGSRFGGIPQSVPPLELPALSLATLGKLIAPAIAIALLGAIESLLSARVADGQIDDKHDPNQELMAQGIANIIAPLFGGFAATGAIARTATNVRSGGRTPIAGLVHSFTLLLVVLLAAPLAQYIPLATLSAIVVLVSINMGEWHEFRELKRYSHNYRLILLSTFLITVVFDLTLAVEIGMALASLAFIYRVQDLTRIERMPLEAHYGAAVTHADGRPRILAFKLYGSLFFGAVGKIEAQLDPKDLQADAIILDVAKVINIDTTALESLENMRRTLAKRGAHIIISGLNEQPASLVRRSGFGEAVGQDNLLDSFTEAILHAQQLLNEQRP
ncbi:MAG: STAS domain-containing protein [Rhodocyclaceae bacterium]|nr:MAG: STAS domain-containing protein [Rhodocyclaceae bacterium]